MIACARAAQRAGRAAPTLRAAVVIVLVAYSTLAAAQIIERLPPIPTPAPAAAVGPAVAPTPLTGLPFGTRRIRLFPRSPAPVQIKILPSPDGQEWKAVVIGGITMVVEGAAEFGVVDVSADRLVIWTSGRDGLDLSGESFQREETPLEIYMEGNIVFRQGERVLYADRMYYNVPAQRGLILDAHLYTLVPKYDGLARVKAGVVEQIDRDRFVARDAAVTTSRLGVPSYYFQSRTLTFQDIQRPLVNPVTGLPVLDPATGRAVVDHQQLAGGLENTVIFEGVPIFYWPEIQTDLQRPSFYLNDIRVRHDNVYGTQIYTDWDAYQLFGIANRLAGTEWELSADYLSDRGPAGGTNFTYDGVNFSGFGGPAKGIADAWFIKDDGLDNLGRDRRRLVPEEEFRGRIFHQHRKRLSDTLSFSSELGYVSDRNFLEQYFEREWDELKDQSTSFELRHNLGNMSSTLAANAHINEFFTQTSGARADHFWLGQSLFDRLTWYEHTQVGYARMRQASTPTGPTDAAKFDPLAWEGNFKGERVATRQEIDLPFSWGEFRIVPYALGELAHWGEDVTRDDLQRAYGQTGVRVSLPMWSVNPEVASELWNLRGLAHKIVFDAELAYSEANRDLTQIPLYDELDDDSVEHFRRRFAFDTYGIMPGGNTPLRFDERFYAVRYGLGGFVTSPSTEIADDLAAVRFGARQRWQTKRGAFGQERIIDWITLDTRAVWFPRKDEDNFGEDLGLAEYDFRWHVGDRVTLLSDGIFDFFDDGQRFFSVGGVLNHPPNGSLYLGVHSLEGPISANVLNAAVSYKMTPKWIAAFGTSVDLGSEGNIGQNFSLTRIGESLLFRAGFNVDASRDSVGFHMALEPRFWPKSRLSRSAGAQTFPAGPYELE
jgi:hypothetical protein